jgi:hypothetical protein
VARVAAAAPANKAAAREADLPAAVPPEVAHPMFPIEPVEQTPSPADERVHLRVAGPDHADVFLDGRLVGHAPLDVALDAQAGERQLLVQKAGYAPWTRKIAGDVTVALTPRLTRAARRPSGSGTSGGARRGDDVYDPFAK